jgi:metal-responsive CopG/Arc/MetJ family transcriptional regulator
MKLSVSIPDEDVTFLDEFAERAGMDSRSAVLHRAIALLRSADLIREYDQAFTEWNESVDATLWNSTTGDGLRG